MTQGVSPTNTISNDTSTSSYVYPAFLGATSGTLSTIYASNANLLYKPSTGELKALLFNADNGIYVNNSTVSANYTISSGQNGFSVGPMTQASRVCHYFERTAVGSSLI